MFVAESFSAGRRRGGRCGDFLGDGNPGRVDGDESQIRGVFHKNQRLSSFRADTIVTAGTAASSSGYVAQVDGVGAGIRTPKRRRRRRR